MSLNLKPFNEALAKLYADGAEKLRQTDGPFTHLIRRRVIMTDKWGDEVKTEYDKGERIPIKFG